jgi:hypothetical protein
MSKNNSVSIRSTESNFQVYYTDRGTSTTLEVVSLGNGQFQVVAPSPKANPTLRISKTNFEDISLELDRSLRPRALVFDLLMIPPTLGLSILIDPFKPTFYSLSSNSKSFEVDMRYTKNYMRTEYTKIAISQRYQDFEDYMKKFPYSEQYQLALNSRDSIVVTTAIKNRDESGLFTFVQGNALSKFYKRANDARILLERSRLRFEAISNSNSPAQFRAFMDEFPDCLEFNAAKTLFYHVSCDSIIELSEAGPKWKFLENNIKELNQISSKRAIDAKSSESLTDKVMLHLYNGYQIAIQQASSSDRLTEIKNDLEFRLKSVPSAYIDRFKGLMVKSVHEYSHTVLNELTAATFSSTEEVLSFYQAKCKSVDKDYEGSILEVLDNKLAESFTNEEGEGISIEDCSAVLNVLSVQLENGRLNKSQELISKTIYREFCSDLYGQNQHSREAQQSLINSYEGRFSGFFEVAKAKTSLMQWLLDNSHDLLVWDELSSVGEFVTAYNAYMIDVDYAKCSSRMKGTNGKEIVQEVLHNQQKIGLLKMLNEEGQSESGVYNLFDSKGRNVTDEYTAFMMKFSFICNNNTMYDMSSQVLENFYSEMEHFSESQQTKIEEVIQASNDLYSRHEYAIREKEQTYVTSTNKCLGGRRFYSAGIDKFNFLLTKITGVGLLSHDYKDLPYANCENGRITNYSGGSSGISGAQHEHRTSYYGARCTTEHNCPFCKGTGSITTTFSKRDEEKQKTLGELRVFFEDWCKTHSDYEDLKIRVEQAFLNYQY